MNPYIMVIVLIIGVILFYGYSQMTKTEYVCFNGDIVSDLSMCPSTTNIPHPSTTNIPHFKCRVHARNGACEDAKGIYYVVGSCAGTLKTVNYWECDNNKAYCEVKKEETDCASIGGVCMRGSEYDRDMSPLKVVVCGEDSTYTPGRSMTITFK